MYICICYGVTEAQIEQALVKGAENRAAIAATLGAGSGCGRCTQHLDAMIEAHRNNAATVKKTATATLFIPQSI